jgi:hypothetical protein
MAHLSERIAVSSAKDKQDAKSNAQQLGYYFPALHWVLRDFMLELVWESAFIISIITPLSPRRWPAKDAA